MERLTYWCDNGHGDGKWFVAIDAEGGEDYGPHVDRLAAYEETGLEPEDFKQTFSEDTILKLAGQALGITPDRLRELKQADDEGRCVVLPFKPPRWVYMCSARFPQTGKSPLCKRHQCVTGYGQRVCIWGYPKGSRGRTTEGSGKGEGGRA